MMRLRLVRVERRQSTPNGNPMWWLHFADRHGPYSTARDATLGFEITPSMEGKMFDVTFDGSLVTNMTESVGPCPFCKGKGTVSAGKSSRIVCTTCWGETP